MNIVQKKLILTLKDACFARKMGITTLTDLYVGSKVSYTRHPSHRHFLSLQADTQVHNGIIKTSLKPRYIQLLLALFAVVFFALPAFSQTQVPGQGTDPTDPNVNLGTSQGANNTDPTAQNIYDSPGQASLVQQQAEQDIPAVAQNVEQKLWPDFGAYNDTYEGLSAFWGDDIISNFFANIGQLIGKWLAEFINGWIADAVQFLTGFLRIFVLNPNIAVNGLSDNGNGNNGAVDDISPYIRQGADVMFSIAIDLLLLLFILCIWKFWTEAAWRGGGNLMGAVGRLIATAGLLLAWPTIYAFEVQITNEMIKAIYFNSADQVAMLDAAMAAAVKGGLVAGAGLLANATAPVAGQVLGGVLAGGVGGVVLGTVGGIIAFVGLMIYLILGGILVAELVYILVLKAIQTALLCAQYMFAPLFLVFFALPDTENVATGFVRSFVEVSLWTFVWVGMLKIMVIIILSDFNPWGKIIMAVGVLQLMIQVPTFLARAQISPMSDFISAGLITGGLLSAGKALSSTMADRAKHFANAVGNFGYAGAKGSPKSQTVEMSGLANEVANPGLLKDIRETGASGKVPDKKKPGEGGNGTPQNPGGQPLNPLGGKPGDKPGDKKAGEQLGADGKPLNAGAKNPDGTPVAGTPPVKGAGDPNNPANKAGTDDPTKNNALSNAAKLAGAAGVLGAAAAVTGAPGSLSTGNAQPGQEGNRDQQLSAQQAAEAAKALNNAANNGELKNADGSPKLGPDGKPLKAAADAKPGEKRDAQGNLIKDPTAVTAVPGKEGDKTGANPANADGKGKDLNASSGAGDLAKTMAAAGLGAAAATAAAKLPGDEVEVHGENAAGGDGKTLASATIPGLKTNTPGATGGAGDKGTGVNAAGGDKTTIAGGKLGADGKPLDVTKADTNVVSKPGSAAAGTTNDKAVTPGLSPAADKLAAANAGITSGKGLDSTTVVSTEDEALNPADPGAPLVDKAREGTFSNKPLAGAGGATTGKDGQVTTSVDGKIVPPQNLNTATGADGKSVTGQTVNGQTVAGSGNAANQNTSQGLNTADQKIDATVKPGTVGGAANGQTVNPGGTAEFTQEGGDSNLATNAALAAGTVAAAGVLRNQGATGDKTVATAGGDKLTPPTLASGVNTDAKLTPGAASINTNGLTQTSGGQGQVVGGNQSLDASLKPGSGNAGNTATNSVNPASGTAELTDESRADALTTGANGASTSVSGVVRGQQQSTAVNQGAGLGADKLTPPPLANSGVGDSKLNPGATTTTNTTGLTGAQTAATNPQGQVVTGNQNLDATVKSGTGTGSGAGGQTINQNGTAEFTQDGGNDSSLATNAALALGTTAAAGVLRNQSGAAAVNNAAVNAGTGADKLTPPALGTGNPGDAKLTPGTGAVNTTGLTGQVTTGQGQGQVVGTNQNLDATIKPGSGSTGSSTTAAVNAPNGTAELTADESRNDVLAAATGVGTNLTGSVRGQQPGVVNNATAGAVNQGDAGKLTPPAMDRSGPVVAGSQNANATIGSVAGAGGQTVTPPVQANQGATLDGQIRPGTSVAGGNTAQPGVTGTADIEQEVSGVDAAGNAVTSVSGVVKSTAQATAVNQAGQGVGGVNAQAVNQVTGGRFVPPPLGGVNGQQNLTGTVTPGNPAQTGAATNMTPPVANADVRTTTVAGGQGVQAAQPTQVGLENIVEETGAAAAVAGAAGVVNTVRQQQTSAAVVQPGQQATASVSANRVPPPPQAVTPGNMSGTQVTAGTGQSVAAPPTQFASASTGQGSAPSTSARMAAPVDGGAGGAGGGGGDDGGDSGPIYTGPGGQPTGPSSSPTSPKNASMFDGYMQAGYRHVPYRVAAANIRLAQGATLGVSKSGRPENVYDSMGHLMHVRFGEGASDEQKGMQIIAGAYGELMSSDAEAYDAARQSAIDAGEHKPQGMAERAASGILAYNGSSWTQTAAAKQRFARSMAKHAALGSQAYVNGEPGNAYTEHLVNRYGPMSEEQQAWATYIMTTNESPESGWSFRMGPATEALIQNGVPISSVSRAVAANPSVLKAQPWLRGAAIRGGIEYMSARADAEIPDGTNALVKDAWFGNRAQTVAPEIVNAIGALTLAGATDADGNSACRDFATVDKVASMVGANGRPEDYVGAYNSLRGGDHVVTRMQASFAGGGGGGGGGRTFNLPSQTVNAGSSSGPAPTYSSGGGVTMGSVSMSGSGPAPSTNMADVDVFLDGGGTPNTGIPGINPNQIPLGNLPQQGGGSTILNARVQQGPPPSASGNLGNLGRIQAPGGNVGSTQGQIQIGRVDMPSGGGGGQDFTDHATVDVETSVSGHVVDYDDPRAAVSNAVSQYGSSQNLVKQVVAELRSHGMNWNDIYDPSKADNDPGKYQLLETAVQAYAQNPASVGSVAVAAKAVGANNVSMQDVQVVQEMFDADPTWNEKNVDYGAVYTARAISNAHDSNPQEYGRAYLTKDYVDSIRQDPRFTPRPIPVRNRGGQVARYDQSPVPKDRLVKRVFERMMGQDGFNNGNG